MRNQLNLLGWIALAVVTLAFLWFIPQLQGVYFSQDVPPEETPALVNEYRRTWAQIIGGFALLIGLYFTWRRVEISQRTLEATQDQQVTERFTRATDQLGATDESGNPRLEIRLGGIYALERIARDSPDRDYSTVIEVLAAYVRENAPWSEQDADIYQKNASMLGWAPTDIQAILDAFKRLEKSRVAGSEIRVRLNLMSANLRSANLEGACLKGAVLTQSHLFGANLRKAHLEGADLRGARLRKANLRKAHLEEAYLPLARLEGAHLEGACLKEANLGGAKLEGAYLEGADFRGAKLGGANLSNASFSKTTLLTQEQVNETHGSKTTLLPEGLVHPEHWRNGTDEQPNGEG